LLVIKIKGRRPYIKLFLIRVVVKTKDLRLAFKEISVIPYK
jgi:hypothetical protein